MKTGVLIKLAPVFCLILFATIFGGQMLIFNHAETDIDRGIASYKQGNYAEAESQMRHALALSPNNAYGSYYLGLCLLHDGDVNGAKQRMKMAETIAHGNKFMQRNEPLEEEVSAALNHLQHP